MHLSCYITSLLVATLLSLSCFPFGDLDCRSNSHCTLNALLQRNIRRIQSQSLQLAHVALYCRCCYIHKVISCCFLPLTSTSQQQAQGHLKARKQPIDCKGSSKYGSSRCSARTDRIQQVLWRLQQEVCSAEAECRCHPNTCEAPCEVSLQTITNKSAGLSSASLNSPSSK